MYLYIFEIIIKKPNDYEEVEQSAESGQVPRLSAEHPLQL